MCETTVYLERNGQQEKVMDQVARLEMTEGGVTLTKLFEFPQTLQAKVREIDFLHHGVTLVPMDTGIPQGAAAPAWILKRRSIRAFTDAPVGDDAVEALLQAAMAAPSANDMRPWDFVVVRDPERRRRLADTHEWSRMCADAPVVIVVVGDPAASDHWMQDCSAATENLLLTATSLDLGAVWVGVSPLAANARPMCAACWTSRTGCGCSV
jgi:predicted RNA-binding protein